MMKRVIVGLALVASVLFAVHPFAPNVETAIRTVSKLLSLGMGALFAGRAARSFDAGPVRTGWLLMRAWFAAFCLGQAGLAAYELGPGILPVPSPGDAFFLIGYGFVTVATVQFIIGYRATGFAAVASRDLLPMLVLWVALFAWAIVAVLAPVARSSSPVITRIVNDGYPVADFVLLLPTLVLLRMTYAFRGGRVWSVWATLLVGIVFTTAGDILFAIPSPTMAFVSPLADIGFTMGYAFAAAGAALEVELLAD